MGNEITFIPLGGGQRVGASCYFLRIGNTNLILDAGIGIENGLECNPDFHFLITSPYLQAMGQIDQIFISHAHMDHVGYLLKLMNQATHASVYMTEVTKVLSTYQLYDRLFLGDQKKAEDIRLGARALLDRIAVVGLMQTLQFPQYKVTFYPAGHIPGAMMMLFESGKRKVLYTGDYSLHPTYMTEGCYLPEGLDIDTVILCGLHAKHPGYKKKSDALYTQARDVLRAVHLEGRSILCQIPQLSKGIEFLKILNVWNQDGIPIYLDRSILQMVSRVEHLSVPILTEWNKPMGGIKPSEPHLFLTAEKNHQMAGFYRTVHVDFSLHDDFKEIKLFLRRLNPQKAVVVHCGREHSPMDSTIEQELMLDSECRTQFIFAEEQEIYRL